MNTETGEDAAANAEATDSNADAAAAAAEQHDTLKYHLLGPSLTKAGQDKVDQHKVSEVIYEASKGSKYFNNEENKDRTLTQKIERILAKKKQLEKLDLAQDRRRADEYVAELELSRDLSQTVVHIDCDAFYAAVEELDRPELHDVPMAVGQGVLTTCNYHARKFGCRSGMAGFVAKKLCPQLISLPLNFEKYTAKAQEVRVILAEYDARFESASIDEAYLNITEYCQQHDMLPWDAVSQLRKEVQDKTHITISAGLAANAKIAKIASNRNKPNGQFQVQNERADILAFMNSLPTRKVNGIGRVFERELDAIGVKTCGHIYDQRQYLGKLFGEKAFQFLMQTYLGLGKTKVQPAEEYERKSVGTESTFRDTSDPKELRIKMRWLAEELEKDLLRTQFKGRTLVLKIKLHTYEVFTRQVIPPKAVATADDLYDYALPMLTKLEREQKGLKLRLMGLRCTHLVSTKKTGRNFFGLQKYSSVDSGAEDTEDGTRSAGEDQDGTGRRRIQTLRDDEGEWEVWPEEEFAQDKVDGTSRTDADERSEALRLSQKDDDHVDDLQLDANEHDSNRRFKAGRIILPNPKPASTPALPPPRLHSGITFRRPTDNFTPSTTTDKQTPTDTERSADAGKSWKCPVCQRPQPPTSSDRDMEAHVDFCLSRGLIKTESQMSAFPPAADNTTSDAAVKRHLFQPASDAAAAGTNGAGVEAGGGARPSKKQKQKQSTRSSKRSASRTASKGLPPRMGLRSLKTDNTRRGLFFQ